MPLPVRDQKRALRAELRQRRRNIPSTLRDEQTQRLTSQLIQLVQGVAATSIACYLSTAYEPNTRPFLNWAAEQGIRVLLPISREDGLLDWVEGDGQSEVEGLFGISEAVGQILGSIEINYVDLIIVPALAVTRSGDRLGQGMGYYDRVLGSMAQSPPVYAVTYDEEILESLPQDANDRQIDGCVTPSGVTNFGTP